MCVQFEKSRYLTAADFIYRSPQHLTATLSLYKDPGMLSTLGFPVTSFSQSEDVSRLIFATAADDRYFHVAMDAIALVQSFFPNNSVYFYDINNNDYYNRADKVNRLRSCRRLLLLLLPLSLLLLGLLLLLLLL